MVGFWLLCIPLSLAAGGFWETFFAGAGRRFGRAPNPKGNFMTKRLVDESVDLSELVERANDSVKLDEARRATRMKRVNLLQRLLPVMTAVALIASVAWAIDSMWHHIAPQSQEKIIRDLDTIIEQARHSIESAKGELGRLPERIPNAALASVVFYDYSGETYRLFVTSGDVSVMLDTDGSKKIDKGRPQ